MQVKIQRKIRTSNVDSFQNRDKLNILKQSEYENFKDTVFISRDFETSKSPSFIEAWKSLAWYEKPLIALSIFGLGCSSNNIDSKVRNAKYYPSGKISSGILNNDTEINGYIFREQHIFFYENGNVNLGFLSQKNPKIKGFSPSQSAFIRFYPTGEIASCVFHDYPTFNGIRFCSGERIYFYKNGSVKSGVIASSYVEKDGTSYSGGTRLYFDKNGKVNASDKFK